VILNWQQGWFAVHAVEVGTASGTWTLTGARAHEHRDEHNGEFLSVSATLAVSPLP
jgi:hypothetical protein